MICLKYESKIANIFAELPAMLEQERRSTFSPHINFLKNWHFPAESMHNKNILRLIAKRLEEIRTATFYGDLQQLPYELSRVYDRI